MTPWTVAYQASLSMGFSRQEYRSGLSFSSPGDLPNPGIKRGSPAFQADSLPSEPPGKNSMNMSLSKLQERVKDKEAWHAVFNGVTKNQTQLMTGQQQHLSNWKFTILYYLQSRTKAIIKSFIFNNVKHV